LCLLIAYFMHIYTHILHICLAYLAYLAYICTPHFADAARMCKLENLLPAVVPCNNMGRTAEKDSWNGTLELVQIRFLMSDCLPLDNQTSAA